MEKTKNLALISEILIVFVILGIILHWVEHGIYDVKPTPGLYISVIILLAIAFVRRGFLLLKYFFQSKMSWSKTAERYWQSLQQQEEQGVTPPRVSFDSGTKRALQIFFAVVALAPLGVTYVLLKYLRSDGVAFSLLILGLYTPAVIIGLKVLQISRKQKVSWSEALVIFRFNNNEKRTFDQNMKEREKLARSKRYRHLFWMAISLGLYSLKFSLLLFEYGVSLLWLNRAENLMAMLKAGCLFWFIISLSLFLKSFYLDELRAELR